MEERSGRPGKHIKVTTGPIDRSNIKVHKTTSANPITRPFKSDQRPTLADYVPPAMDDPGIDKAIDDIIVSESNEVLAAEDSMYNSSGAKATKKTSSRLSRLFKSKWLYIGLGIVIIGVFAWPYSRYAILSQFIQKDYKFTVIDSVTLEPVSGATLSVGSQQSQTNAAGQTDLKLPLGKHSYKLSKHYYALATGNVFVGLSNPIADNVSLMATGRQVPITVVNKLSGRRLSGVKISILDTSSITNSHGQVNIVLPTKSATYEATISANGFNSLTTPVKVTTLANVNLISLVPMGSVYYLSKSTGTINVVKANLDGSNPTTELAGTGHETAVTKLIPSPDNKYLLLEAERSGSQPELYVINTASGNLTEFDSSPDSFSLIGWSGDLFLYDETATSSDPSTIGREQLKSFNALNSQLNVLDENQVVGSSPSYGYQSFNNFELLPDLLVYTTSWTSVNNYDISGQNDTIRSVAPNGLNKKDYSTFVASITGALAVVRNLPESLYISVNNASTNQTSYYTFSSGSLTTATITAATFATSYPTYFISPSGEDSLWTTSGTPTVFTANASGQNSARVIVPAGFSAYGWYDNVYILLTKGSQLYISPASGSNSPVLIGSYLAS